MRVVVLFSSSRAMSMYIYVNITSRFYDELQGRGDDLRGLGMQLPICPGFNGCPIRRTGRALLGDFGLVRLLESTCDLAHTRVGTPYYLSPEPLGHLGWGWEFGRSFFRS